MVHKTGVHRCPDCPKTFSRLEYVARHRRVQHLGARPWACACGASYARSDLLSRHRRKCTAPPRPDGRTGSKSRPALPPRHVEPAADFAKEPVDDGCRPPSYQQAIAEQPPLAPIPDPPTPTEPHPHPPPHPAHSTLPVGAPASRAVAEAAGRLPCAPSLPDDSDDDDEGEDDAGTNGGPGRDSGEATNIVPLVKFSDPAFFVSDVPRGSAFYLHPEVWALAFLCQRSQGFTIPHIGSLSGFLAAATRAICPAIPMFHVPTLRASQISIHLGYALSVSGAALESSEHALAFTDQSLSYKRTSVQNDFLRQDRCFAFRFELLQAQLIYQYLGMFSRLAGQRRRAAAFSPTIVRNFRELAFVDRVRRAPDYVLLALSGALPLEGLWKEWVEYEGQKRTAFLLLISVLHLSGPDALGLSEADLRLPCHEDLWTAGSATSWMVAARRQAARCLRDNPAATGGSSSGAQLVGEAALPRLSDALAALRRSPPIPPIPDIFPVGPARLTVPAARLGSFARTVILHARALAHQAVVDIHILHPPPLNI